MWRLLSKVLAMEQRDFMSLLAQPIFFLNERFIASRIFVCFWRSHHYLVPVTRYVLSCTFIYCLNNCASMWRRNLVPNLLLYCIFIVFLFKVHCATSRKVAVSIPVGAIRIFHCHNPSGRPMTVGSTQPLTEMSTRNTSWG